MSEQPTALLSVYDKDPAKDGIGIVDFARGLIDLGWRILSSGGTATRLRENNIPVTDIATIVGDPLLGHRVVTLSRELNAGILAKFTPEDEAELKRNGISRIDMVCVDFYPLLQEMGKGKSFLQLVEFVDVGGPTMLHAGSKGLRIVVSKRSQRQPVLNWLKDNKPREREMCLRLMRDAEQTVIDHLSAFRDVIDLELARESAKYDSPALPLE